MATKRLAIAHDDDVVLYATSDQAALHTCAVRLYELAKTRAAANDAEVVDRETGEIRGRVWRFTFGEEVSPLTVKQRGFYHAAVLTQIAEQVSCNGIRYVMKVWKEYYRDLMLGDRYEALPIPGEFTPKGKPKMRRRKVRISTEDLSIKQYSELIDKVIAHAAVEFGVAFNFDRQEREEVRYRRPARKAKPTPESPL